MGGCAASKGVGGRLHEAPSRRSWPPCSQPVKERPESGEQTLCAGVPAVLDRQLRASADNALRSGRK